jgi:hypothetical protein
MIIGCGTEEGRMADRRRSRFWTDALASTIAVGLMALALGSPARAGDRAMPGEGSHFRAYQAREALYRRLQQEAVSRAGDPVIHAPGGQKTHQQSDSFQTVKKVQEISRDTLQGVPPSEGDTQVEPDIAVDPNDPRVVVAVFQEGRFPDGAAVDTGYASSRNGGKSWQTAPLGVTVATGGEFERASDPVVAIGPDGSVYAESLAVTLPACHTAIVVQRSDDSGRTFEDPVAVQDDSDCGLFNDKNWIAVDTFRGSPSYGRVYAAWDREDTRTGFVSPMFLRFSDDHGETWSSLINVSGEESATIGAQPVVQPNGDLSIFYISLFDGGQYVQTSHDGGLTFDSPALIDFDAASSPPDIRTGFGLPSASVDPATGTMSVVWQDSRFRAGGLNDVVISRSFDGGATWSALARVNPDAVSSELDHLNPDVAADGGFVHVTYLTRDNAGGASGFLEERYIVSSDGGLTFGGELSLGLPIDLAFAAAVGPDLSVKFPGDYMGLAATGDSIHPIWERSFGSKAEDPFHQTTWSAIIEK